MKNIFLAIDRWYRSSLGNRISFAMIIIGSITFLAMLLLTVSVATTILTKQLDKSLSDEIQLGKKIVERDFERVMSDLDRLAWQFMAIEGELSSKKPDLMSDLIDGHPLVKNSYAQLAIYDFNGGLKYQPKWLIQPKLYLDREYLNDQPQGQLIADDFSGVKLIRIIYPVKLINSNQSKYYLELILPISNFFSQELALNRDPRDWELFSYQGNLNKGLNTKTYLEEALDLPDVLDHLKIGIRLQKKKILVDQLIEKLSFVVLIFGCLLMAFLGVIGRQLGRALVEPLKELTRFSRNIAEVGIVEINLNRQNQDEIGDLADSFKKMLTHLRGLQNHLLDTVEQTSGYLTAILDVCPDGVLAISPDQKITYLNSVLAVMLGLEKSIWQGASLSDFENWISKYQLEVSTNFSLNKSQRLVLVFEKKRVFDLLVRRNQAGSLIIYWRDLTDVNELEQLKNKFLATAAHELRTPLSSVLGFAELLSRDSLSSEERVAVMKLVDNQALLLKNMIRDLLDLARQNYLGEKSDSISKCDLSEIVSDTLKSYSLANPSRKILIEPIEPRALIWVEANKFCQVFINILDNANKYSDMNMPIRVMGRRKKYDGQEYIGIQVKDYGPGIPQDCINFIGEPFYRAPTVQNIPGSGLGLSIVKTMLRSWNAHLEINSVEGDGVSVTAWFPLADEA